MSYDLMVFDVSKAPKTKKEFLSWYEKITKWGKDISYDNPDDSSPLLKNWFMEMKETFPQMNGPYAPSEEAIDKDEELEIHLADYSIDTDAIYVCFAWSLADKAYNLTRKLSEKYGVGFFNASSQDGDIILPDLTMIGATPREELEMKLDIWHKRDEYQKCVDAMLAFPEKDSDLLLTLAVEYNNIKQYDKAVEILIKIKDDFEDEPAHWHYVLGYAYRYMGCYNEAIENIEISLKLSDNYYGYMDILAYCYYKIGKESLAKKTIKKSIEDRIDDIEENYDDEEYKEVIESLVNEYTVELCDEEMFEYLLTAYHKTGDFYLEEGKKLLAKKQFEAALKIKPDDKHSKDSLLKC